MNISEKILIEIQKDREIEIDSLKYFLTENLISNTLNIHSLFDIEIDIIDIDYDDCRIEYNLDLVITK